MSDKIQKDLTTGNVSKQMIKFAIPFLIANMLQAFYSVADMLIVGYFTGSNGIASVNLGSMVTFILTSLVIGFSIGGSVLISQYVGAKRTGDVNETIGTLLTFFLITGLIMTVVGFIAATPILRAINTPEEIFGETWSYLMITVGGTVFIFGYNAVSAILRGVGDSVRPMIIIGIASVLHVILCYIFVGLMGTGVVGSAWSTVISQASALVLAIAYLRKNNFIFDFKLKSFKMIKDKLRLVVKIGLPSAIQMTLVSASFLGFISFINAYGVEASAAAAVGGKIDGFAILPGIALAASIAPMVGQNIGAGRHDRVIRTFLTGGAISLFFGIVIAVSVNVFAPQLVWLFDRSEEVIRIGSEYLHFVSISYVLAAIMFAMNGLSNGSGHTWFTMGNMVLNAIVMRFGLIYLFSFALGWGLDGIFLGFGLSPLLSCFVGAWFIISGRWKRSKLGIAREPAAESPPITAEP